MVMIILAEEKTNTQLQNKFLAANSRVGAVS